MPDKNISVIGFDYGTHWIGSAVGQTQTCTASPLLAIKVRNNQPDWCAIARLIDTWQPACLVVGLPTSMQHKPSPMTQKARRFSHQLEGRYHLKTELIDERLTTREAWQIVEQSATRRVSKQDIDCIAAVLITETWLNQQADPIS